MNNYIFTDLSIVLALSIILATVARMLRQPLLIGYILAGIVAGPLLGIVKGTDNLESFSKIGIALLLFIVGLGLNPKIIKDLGKAVLLAGLVQMLIASAFGTSFMLLVGQDLKTSLIIGAALAFSSTIVGLKLLTDKREQTRLYGRIVIGILLVQDLVATLVLLVLSMQEGRGFSVLHSINIFGKSLLLAISLILLGNKIIPKISKFVSTNS